MDLNPPRSQKERLLHDAATLVLDWLEDPTRQTDLNEGWRANADHLSWQPPATGRPQLDVLRELIHEIVRRGTSPAHPGFMAYVPNTALWATSVADLLADTFNRYPTVRAPGAGPARVEDEVLRWFCDWVGYGAGSGGLFTSGGSMANLSAFVAAREQVGQDDLRKLRWYCTAQTHHSNHKAARTAGVPEAACAEVEADASGAMEPRALAEAIERDRADGRVPLLVVATAGTTGTGVVDPLGAISETCTEADVWMHTDAAYGGFFVLCDEGRQALAGLDHSDSITLDPHKGLGLPFGTGALVVRDLDTLYRANAMGAPYMPEAATRYDAADLGIELSRSWRGLRVWLPIMLHGLDAFRDHVDRSLELARHAAASLEAIEHIELHRQPALSAFAFRWTGGEEATRNEDNQSLLDTINQDGRVFLSGATIDGYFWLRVCILNAATTREHVDALVAIVEAASKSR